MRFDARADVQAAHDALAAVVVGLLAARPREREEARSRTGACCSSSPPGRAAGSGGSGRGSAQRPRCRLTWPITFLRRPFVSITVIVSWPLFATNTRRPFGEMTMFHGSAPVVIVPPAAWSTPALNRFALALVILITETVPDGGVGHVGVLVVRVERDALRLVADLDRREHLLVFVWITETLSAPGLTLHTNLPSADIGIGLELVGAGVAPCARRPGRGARQATRAAPRRRGQSAGHPPPTRVRERHEQEKQPNSFTQPKATNVKPRCGERIPDASGSAQVPREPRRVARRSPRRRAPAADGQSVIRPPANTISAPTQIQLTSGETSTRNVAGGGSCGSARPGGAAPRRAAAARSAAGSDARLLEHRVAAPDRRAQRRGVRRDRRPEVMPKLERSPTSLVASPSK